MLAARLEDHDDTPTEDKIVVLRGMRWSDYERMLEVRGERGAPRFAYLDGELEIMTPSRSHESIKSRIGRLVEVWCLESGVEFSPYGSWTLANRGAERGLEPDECYVFGNVAEPLHPDLAIEVVWTTGGIRKLDISRALAKNRSQIRSHLLERSEQPAPAQQTDGTKTRKMTLMPSAMLLSTNALARR